MPPDAGERLDLRLKEARAADRRARDAARQLLLLLQQGANGDVIRVGFDRLQKESLELGRRTLTVRDELGAGVHASENLEIEALTNKAETWRQFIVESRSAEPNVAAGRLELLLGHSAAQ